MAIVVSSILAFHAAAWSQSPPPRASLGAAVHPSTQDHASPSSRSSSLPSPSPTPGRTSRRATSALHALLLLTRATGPSAALVARVADTMARSERYATRPLAAILPLLRQRDREKHVIARANALTEEARRSLLALDHQRAKSKLLAAQKILETSFVALYEPRRIARVHLLKAVTFLHRARPDLAREAFVVALHMDPSLTLDAHYSPQVRSALATARKNIPPRPLPRRGLIARALRTLPRGQLAVVLTGERTAAGLIVLRALTLAPQRKTYTDIDALTVTPGDSGAKQRVERFSQRLRQRLEEQFPAPPPRPTTEPATQSATGPTSHPPPPRPWYKRWYIWAIAGAVVGAAVVIPVATHKDVVQGRVRW